MNNKKTVFLNSLYMDFSTENELDLFLKSLVEIWTDKLYSELKQNEYVMWFLKFGTKDTIELHKFFNMKVRLFSKSVKGFFV